MSPVRPLVKVVGHRLDADHHRLRDFLTRAAQPHEFLEHGSQEAAALLSDHGASEADLPLMVDSGEVRRRVTVEDLVEAWRLADGPARSHYDLVIVGAGPAGLAAAVYAASDGLSVLVVERDLPGGQASHTSSIENFFGFPDGIGGAELARLAGRQAEGFGAELQLMRGVVGHAFDSEGRLTFQLEGGDEAGADVALLAAGMEWRRLEVPGVEELLGMGVYYGAGRSEAARCGGDDVLVVGAGNSAGQAVMNLAAAGARVKLIVRGDGIARSMSAYLVDRIERNPQIEVSTRTRVTGVHEEGGRLAAVAVEDAGGARERLAAQALFLCIGGTPRTRWAREDGPALDSKGFVYTGPDLLTDGRPPDEWPLKRQPLPLETNIPGLFAAGDIRHGSIKRVAGAVGDGAMAVALAHTRLEEIATGSAPAGR